MKKVEIYNGIVVEHIFPDKKLDIERLVRDLVYWLQRFIEKIISKI